MKNLKRVLALGLALVMIFGMMSFASAAETTRLEKPATASDFKDWDDVTHKDAVALAVDLDIINGVRIDDTTFNYKPGDNLMRSAWAKLLYVAMTGTTEAYYYADSTADSVGGFSDVPGSHFAAGYIAYLTSGENKVLAGKGDGKFDPDGNVTLAEACKTLLVALGYDATREKLEGSSWSTNSMRLAKKEALLDNVTETNPGKALTRDDAAQMIFNVLFKGRLVKEEDRDMGEWYVKGYSTERDPSFAAEVHGIKAVTATVNKIEDGKAVLTDVSTTASTAAGNGSDDNNVTSLVSGKLPATSDMLGRKVTLYVKINNNNVGTALKSTGLTVSNSGVILDTFASVKLDKTDDANSPASGKIAIFYKDGEGKNTAFKGEAADTISIYVNGAEPTVAKIKDETLTKNSDNDNDGALTDIVAKAAQEGNRVQLISTAGDGKINVIKINEYTVKKASADAKVSEDGKKVEIADVLASATEIEKVKGYDGVKKDDVVVTYMDGDVTYIEALNPTVGKVTGASSDHKITVGGQKLERSGMAGVTEGNTVVNDFADWTVSANKDNEYKFYLDKNGKVAWIVLVSGETGTSVGETKPAMITEIGVVKGAGTVDELGNTTDGTQQAKARLVYADGTSEVVTVSKYEWFDGSQTKGGKIDKTTIDYWKAAGNSGPESAASLTATAWFEKGLFQKGQAGTYVYVAATKDKDGNYELYRMLPEKDDDTSHDSYQGLTKISSNAINPVIKFDGTNSANNATKFLIETVTTSSGTTEVSYTTMTGYKGLPKYKAAQGVSISYKDAQYVVLSTTGELQDTEVKDLVYVKSADFEQTVDGFVFDIVNAKGESTTLTVDETVKEKLVKNEAVPGFYALAKKNDKGVVTGIGNKENMENVTSNGNGVFTTANKSFTWDEDTVCVVIDLAKNSAFKSAATFNPDTAVTGDAYSSVVALTDAADNGSAHYIYVVRTAK